MSADSSPEQFADKMDSLVRLAGGIAHEYDDLLGAIVARTDKALASTDLVPSVRAELNDIRAAGTRATEINRQLMAFAGNQALSLRPFRVNDLVRQLEPAMRRRLPQNVTLDLQFHTNAIIEADADRLEAVLLSLLGNAIEAIPSDGTVTVATMDPPELRAATERSDASGSFTMIVVGDTGVGLTQIARERLFEPFFTTRDHGKHKGLSLASVFGTVRQLAGRVEVESAPGLGTQVRLMLPTVANSASPAALTQAARDLDSTETVLVVEDELAVRATISKALRRVGYRVLEATNGEDALRVMQKHHAPIHLVISDVMMPEMRGTELVGMLHSWYPNMRVLFISGYSPQHVEAPEQLGGETPFLAKPFTMNALVERVRYLLDAD